eukprot:5251855-Alexandrium_andersonii.AAC.1
MGLEVGLAALQEGPLRPLVDGGLCLVVQDSAQTCQLFRGQRGRGEQQLGMQRDGIGDLRQFGIWQRGNALLSHLCC